LLTNGPSEDGPNFVEATETASRIELAASIADTFPIFLDYMYAQFSNNGNVGHLRPNAFCDFILLYWLADYFEAPQLCQDIDAGFETETFLNVSNSGTVMSRAVAYGVQHIVDTVMKFCLTHLLEYDQIAIGKLATALDAATLLNLLQNKDNSDDCSRKASEIVAAFCIAHEVDAETFATLTDADLLPCIDIKAIWPLLEKEREFIASEEFSVSSLQTRCIDVLAKDFSSLDTTIDGHSRDNHRALCMCL
jgi:hypothetical protein